MQIIRENCFECVGPKRDACDALFEGVRTNVANMCREGAELMLNDSLVGMMELQEKSASQCAETAVALRGLGCTLSDEDARTALLSEYLIAVDLATFELEEEDRKEQEKIDEAVRIQCEKADTLLARIAKRRTETGPILEKSHEVAQLAQDVLVRIKSLQTEIGTDLPGAQNSDEALMKAEAEKFCEDQGWNVDELCFADRLELNAHLRSQGFSL